MKTNDPLKGRRVRLALVLWLAGMIGAVMITVAVIPQLGEQHALPMPVWLLMVASLCQSALLIGLAVWAGTALSPAVGASRSYIRSGGDVAPAIAGISGTSVAWSARRCTRRSVAAGF